MWFNPDVRWLSVRRYDCIEFKPAGNDVMGCRHGQALHGPARPLLAGVFAGHRLCHRHISRNGHLFAVYGSGHSRQFSV